MTIIARHPRVAALVVAAMFAAAGVGGYKVYRIATDLTVVGVYNLGAGQFADANGFSCHGVGEFADIRNGARVVVTDDSGAIVGTGQLGVGTGSAELVTPECRFEFRIARVPAGSKSYSVEVSHRGQVRYTRGEVEQYHYLGFGA